MGKSVSTRFLAGVCWQHDCPPGHQRVQALACPGWHMLGPAIGSSKVILANGWVHGDVEGRRQVMGS